jgi:hypothetical protein
MKTINIQKIGPGIDNYTCLCKGTHICNIDHSGTYVPLADYERLRRALERMVANCARYLEERVESESTMYDPNYVSPLTEARKALEG